MLSKKNSKNKIVGIMKDTIFLYLRGLDPHIFNSLNAKNIVSRADKLEFSTGDIKIRIFEENDIFTIIKMVRVNEKVVTKKRIYDITRDTLLENLYKAIEDNTN